MGIKRIVDVDFWDSEEALESMTPEDKYFYLFLLTNPNARQLGVYYLPLRKACFYTGYTKESILNLLNRFEHQFGLIRYNPHTSEVAIKNYLKHAIVKGGTPVLNCLHKEFKEVKDVELVKYIADEYEKTSEDKNKTVIDFFASIFNDNDNDNDNERIAHESPTNRKGKINKFENFDQREYDYKKLERELLK